MTDLRSIQYSIPDKHPEQTEAAVLRVLAKLGRWDSMQARAISRVVQGTDKFGRGQTGSALGRLNGKKLIVEIRRGTWRITDVGRAALALYDELNDGGTAA